MIISHKHKFIFIKTMKTAGTSIEIFLSPLCAESDIVTPIFPVIEPHRERNYRGLWNPIPEMQYVKGKQLRTLWRRLFKQKKFYNHIPAAFVKNRVGEKIWNEYYKFCVERNPWDKTLSHYHWINDKLGGNLSFQEYLEKKDFCLNYPRYTDSEGNLLVNRVIKYESLKEGLSEVFDRFGIPFNGELGVRAKATQRKDKRPYQEIYTSDQARLIKNAFQKEISLHSYKFD